MICRREDIKGFGEKMFATHKGLSKQYEVSCKELDFLVEAVSGYAGSNRSKDDGWWFWWLHYQYCKRRCD